MARMLFSLLEVALLAAPSLAYLNANERAYYASQGILEVPLTAIVSFIIFTLPEKSTRSLELFPLKVFRVPKMHGFSNPFRY